MTYLEALERASTFISNELALSYPVPDKPNKSAMFSFFMDKNGMTISIWKEEEDCNAET